MKIRLFLSVIGMGSLTLIPGHPYATNGMALSEYGAIPGGLGGASQAFDTGNFGAINNAATLGLMEPGSRFEVGISLMHINAETWDMGTPRVQSQADWFAMPSLSYVVKNGQFTYGVGLFSQGGLGADYGKHSFLSLDPNSGLPTGLRDNSEVMIGRLIAPLAFAVNDRLTLGASLDLVYGRLTMRQAMPSQALIDMMTPGQQTLGVAVVDPNTAMGLGSVNYAHLDFSKLDNWGLGGQLGLTFKVNDALTLGASYQFETQMGDLEGNGSINAGVGGFYQTMRGKVRILDFQWPATLKFGLAFRPTESLLLVADIKRYDWSSVMDSVRIAFRPHAGGYIDIDMYQKWDDQTVWSFGAEYRVNPQLRLRAGFNYASNPIPANYLQHLGEAITETHLSLGIGYDIDARSQINAAYVHTFENEDTNINSLVGLSSSLEQDTFILSYSYRF